MCDRVLGMDICISVGPLEQSYILCKHELICYHGTQGKSKREDVQQVSVDSRWLEIVWYYSSHWEWGLSPRPLNPGGFCDYLTNSIKWKMLCQLLRPDLTRLAAPTSCPHWEGPRPWLTAPACHMSLWFWKILQPQLMLQGAEISHLHQALRKSQIHEQNRWLLLL